MNGKSHDNIDHMHTLVQQLQSLLGHMVEVGRSELDDGYDRQMVDAFASAIINASHSLQTMHSIIDQDFQPITQEDVMAAFRQRLGITKHGTKQLVQETRGVIPLSDLPNWDAPTFDPGTPEQRREQSVPQYRGKHQPSADLPEERGENNA